ncbi:elongator complex protein 5-like isoform X2 [Xenia sp. Carnegie-2017]|nr:elongator complex protein 5-like isoform X2 [Xenia sp. Carnegie-2017]
MLAFDKFSKSNRRLYIYDGISDPLRWINIGCNDISSSYICKNILVEVTKDENFIQLLPDKLTKVSVVINSLSMVIHHGNQATISKDLFEVIHFKTPKLQVYQTVALVHSDLHEKNSLLSLNYMASTCVHLLHHDFNGGNFNGYLAITHLKSNGKLYKKTETYRCTKNDELEFAATLGGNKKYLDNGTKVSENEDVLSNLTFNLSLTDEQKKIRDQLQLPYLLDEKTKKIQLELGKESKIFYEADANDDLDEEDPDDDLNF